MLMFKAALVVAMLAATVPADNRCGSADGPAGSQPGGKDCITALEEPRVALRPMGLVIVTYSVSRCVIVPMKHVVHLALEHQVDSEKGSERGDWKPMPTYDGASFRSCEPIPYPGSDVRCEYFIPCIVAGWYRPTATITGSGAATSDMPQGLPFTHTVNRKPLAKITCHP